MDPLIFAILVFGTAGIGVAIGGWVASKLGW